MPAAVRLGDMCSGHECWPPRANTSASPNVLVNGLGLHRVGDGWGPHTCPSIPETHSGTAATGSASVFSNGSSACRVGDAVDCGSTMASGSPNVFIGDKGLDGVFESRRRQLEESGNLSDQDKLLLCIPDIAEAEAGRAETAHDAQGWLYLQEFLHKWFVGPASTDRDKAQPVFVDWDWLLAFGRVQGTWDELRDPEYLFSDNARQVLSEYLERDGYLTGSGGEFDYTVLPLDQLHSRQFQFRGCDSPVWPDGLLAAIGAFTIYALAKGHTEPTETGWRIAVTSVSFFVRDSFDFEGDQVLGHFDCEDLELDRLLSVAPNVSNSDFRNFRSNLKVGQDFYVFAMPSSVDSFEWYLYEK